MKRLFHIIVASAIFLAVVLLPSLSDFLPVSSPVVDADASSYCSGQGYTDSGTDKPTYEACQAGYNGGTGGTTEAKSCASYTGSDKTICDSVWANNAPNSSGGVSTTIKPPTNLASGAASTCNQVESGGNSATIAACEIGFDAAANGTTEDTACTPLGAGTRTVGSSTECQSGFSAYQAEQEQDTDCPTSKYSGSQLTSCLAGLAAAKAGKDDTVCTQMSGDDQTACQAGYGAGGGTSPSDPSDPSGPALTCDTKITDPLTWILCPVINILTDMVDTLDGLITNELDIKADTIFCSDTQKCQAYHEAWASFRDIALGLMVAGGVIMLIAHSIGMEVLDAYTIRKVLPRILIAAVAISLSWALMRFFVNMSDALGYGIRNIIYSPFSNLKSSGIDLSFGSSFGGGLENFFFGSLGFVAAVGGGIAAIGIIISLAGTAALAVLIAVFVLVIRQIAITLLILVAPIAIVAYIFPNTHEIYRLWWDSFSKALLMFPLIAAFIATGRVFSAISLAGGGDILHDIIGFLAYFAPYFLIPATFKLAGGAIRQIGGFVNDRSRGGFDRLRQGRVNKMQTLGQRAKAGELYEGKKWMPGSMKAADIANRRIAGVGTGYRGRYGLGKRGKEAIAQREEIAAQEASKDPHLQSIAGNDLANRILAMGMGDARKGRDAAVRHLMSGGDDGNTFLTEAQATARADAAMKSAGAATRFTKAAGVVAFRNMTRGGTAIRDTNDLSELAATVGEGNFGNTYGLAAEAASVSRQVGRSDLASSAEAAGMLALSRSDQLSGRTENAALYNPTRDGGEQKSHAQLQYEAWETAAGGETGFSLLSNGKSRTVKNNTRTAVEVMKNHRADIEAGRDSRYTQREVQFAAASLQDTKETLSAGQGRIGNRRAAQEEMDQDGGALNWYLDTAVQIPQRHQVGADLNTHAPIYQDSVKNTTNREVVEGVVGGRYGGMSAEQRAAEMARGGGAEQDNPQQP